MDYIFLFLIAIDFFCFYKKCDIIRKILNKKNIMLYSIIIWILISLLTISFAIVFFLRKRHNFKRALNLTFLKVTLPKKESDLDEKKETTKDFKEQIALMEQLLASLKSIYSNKILTKILGQDIISFEYIAYEWEIFFYVVIPKKYKALIEKQINSFYVDAVIEEDIEPNIFENKKYIEWTYINTKKDFFLPFKTYQKLESDPINNITNALSKLEEAESAAIQILLKPVDDDWQKDCSDASSKIMKWKKTWFSLNPFKLLISLIDLFSTDDKKENTPEENKTSALTQERAKTVDEKADKTGYEVIIRVIVAWNDKAMVEAELKNIISSFTQFSYPDFNKFTYTIRHNSKALIKNYIFRYFKKPFWLKKMILNTEEIASLFHFPHKKYNKTPEIKWQNFKIVKAPKNIPKEWLLIWHNIYRWIKKEIRIKMKIDLDIFML